jgi:hypothetical protein
VKQPSITRLYRRLRFGEPVVVVSGLPRSGTSMLMKMLDAGGLPVMTDGRRVADEDNPRGYFEVERVKGLDRETDRRWLAEARGKGVKIISHLLRFLPADLNYRVVFVRRDIEEVLASQKKMLTRRGKTDDIPPERMRELFEKDVAQALSLLGGSPRFEVLEVRYPDVLGRPLEEARRIADFVGRRLDVEAMAEVVDPQLHRNRAGTAGQ